MLTPLRDRPDDLMDKLVLSEQATLMLYQLMASYLSVLKSWTETMVAKRPTSDEGLWNDVLYTQRRKVQGLHAALVQVKCTSKKGPEVLATAMGGQHFW